MLRILTELLRAHATPQRARRRTSRLAASSETLEVRRLLAADLIVQSAELLETADDADPTKVTVFVTFDIRNVGNAAVNLAGAPGNAGDNVIMQLFLSSDEILDGGDDPAGSKVIVLDPASLVLNPGQVTGTFVAGTMPIVATNRFLLLQVDSGNDVAEDSEANNVAAIPVSTPNLLLKQILEPLNIPRKVASLVGTNIQHLDLDTLDHNGGALRAEIVAAKRTDVLRMRASGVGADLLQQVDGNLTLGGNTIGTITGGTKRLPLQINFTGAVNRQLVNRILNNLEILVKSRNPNPRVLNFTATDPQAQVSAILSRRVFLD